MLRIADIMHASLAASSLYQLITDLAESPLEILFAPVPW